MRKTKKATIKGTKDILRFLEYAEKTGNQKWASVASQNAGIAYNNYWRSKKL